MWIRLETGWHRDSHVKTLKGTARHVLVVIWCLAAEEGEPTFDAKGEPEHSELPLEFLEPTALAMECNEDVPAVRAAVEVLRAPIPATEWSPESAPRISVDVPRGVAIVRNVGKYQAVAIKDRMRARAKSKAPWKVHGVPRKPHGRSTEGPRKRRNSSVVSSATTPTPAEENCAGEGSKQGAS